MKKTLRFIVLIVFILPLFTQTVMADETTFNFSDLDETTWAYESIQKLVEAKIIQGYPDGTFKPEGFITRAELVKITNLIFSYTYKLESTNLTDIYPEDWYYEHVMIAQEAGYIIGFEDGTFRPNDNISREQLSKIIVTINKLVELPFDKIPADEISPWAVEYVNRVLSNRIMALDDNNNFRAKENVTRAEACDALAKFLLTDETDTETISGGSGSSAKDDGQILYEVIDSVIIELEQEVIPALTSDNQIGTINDIINSMKKYLLDKNHNYEEAAQKAYEKYKQLPEQEQKDLKYQIQYNVTTKNLLILKDFFFPDADINNI